MKKHRINEVEKRINGRVIEINSITYPVIMVDIGTTTEFKVKETPVIFPNSSCGILSCIAVQYGILIKGK